MRCLSVAAIAAVLCISAPARADRYRERFNRTIALRDHARRYGIPNVHYETVNKQVLRFWAMRSGTFRHDSAFAAHPDHAAHFFDSLNYFGREHGLGIVGLAVIRDYSHPLFIGPVQALGERLQRMDATDPSMGGFANGKKTRIVDLTRPRSDMLYGLWLVDRGRALTVANAAARRVAELEHIGMNCAQFATTPLKELKELGEEEFQNFHDAHRAWVYATGYEGERGFAAPFSWGIPPHLTLQVTNPDWQAWAMGEGSYEWEGQRYTREIELTFPIQE